MQPTSKYRTFLIFGAPGTGKGTQGRILGQLPEFVHVSCGDVFRALDPNSKLGKVFLEYSSEGRFVPNDLTIQLWHDQIDKLVQIGRFHPETDYLVLDGIPRNLSQAQEMDRYIDICQIIYLRCQNIEVLVRRMKQRALHESRLDDANEQVIRWRLKEYEAQTAPTLSHYSSDLVTEIDATGTPLEVLSEIIDTLQSSIACRKQRTAQSA
ncbi:MAG: nucleoside monophosphate kinase [Candidatus Poribacteria bacterium]|nr:nucleoside monophosphate kinase [Candidatus Poribacteria bacterium]